MPHGRGISDTEKPTKCKEQESQLLPLFTCGVLGHLPFNRHMNSTLKVVALTLLVGVLGGIMKFCRPYGLSKV